jgi:demethoxyubiquinone hydroxylase (CLK1/Coq7/Cat5 family)
MLRYVAILRTDVSKEPSASFIRVKRIGELGALAVTSNRSTLRRNTKYHLVLVKVIDRKARGKETTRKTET